ncbi:hypothetical protein [Actinacidiphila alni]|nr:hypothetical protein [Actinacidiphila alni]
MSSMPFGVLLWVRPVRSGHVVYVTDQLLAGLVPPWREPVTKGR